MRLFLQVGEKVLDSIQLDPQKVKEEEYIDSLCRLLLVKHELAILAHLQEPSFYIQVYSDFKRINKKGEK